MGSLKQMSSGVSKGLDCDRVDLQGNVVPLSPARHACAEVVRFDDLHLSFSGENAGQAGPPVPQHMGSWQDVPEDGGAAPETGDREGTSRIESGRYIPLSRRRFRLKQELCKWVCNFHRLETCVTARPSSGGLLPDRDREKDSFFYTAVTVPASRLSHFVNGAPSRVVEGASASSAPEDTLQLANVRRAMVRPLCFPPLGQPVVRVRSLFSSTAAPDSTNGASRAAASSSAALPAQPQPLSGQTKACLPEYFYNSASLRGVGTRPPSFSIPSNETDEKAVAPARWVSTLMLRADQLRTLQWMKGRELSPAPFQVRFRRIIDDDARGQRADEAGQRDNSEQRRIWEVECVADFTRRGGILADAMGSGKTVTMVALIESQRETFVGGKNGCPASQGSEATASSKREGEALSFAEVEGGPEISSTLKQAREDLNLKKEAKDKAVVATGESCASGQKKDTKPKPSPKAKAVPKGKSKPSPKAKAGAAAASSSAKVQKPENQDAASKSKKTARAEGNAQKIPEACPNTTLIVVPKHIVKQWAKEFAKFLPKGRIQVLEVSSWTQWEAATKNGMESLRQYDVVVCAVTLLSAPNYKEELRARIGKLPTFHDPDEWFWKNRDLEEERAENMSYLEEDAEDYFLDLPDGPDKENQKREWLAAEKKNIVEDYEYAVERKKKWKEQHAEKRRAFDKKIQRMQETQRPLLSDVRWQRVVFDEVHELAVFLEDLEKKSKDDAKCCPLFQFDLSETCVWGITGTPDVASVEAVDRLGCLFQVDILGMSAEEVRLLQEVHEGVGEKAGMYENEVQHLCKIDELHCVTEGETCVVNKANGGTWDCPFGSWNAVGTGANRRAIPKMSKGKASTSQKWVFAPKDAEFPDVEASFGFTAPRVVAQANWTKKLGIVAGAGGHLGIEAQYGTLTTECKTGRRRPQVEYWTKPWIYKRAPFGCSPVCHTLCRVATCGRPFACFFCGSMFPAALQRMLLEFQEAQMDAEKPCASPPAALFSTRCETCQQVLLPAEFFEYCTDKEIAPMSEQDAVHPVAVLELRQVEARTKKDDPLGDVLQMKHIIKKEDASKLKMVDVPGTGRLKVSVAGLTKHREKFLRELVPNGATTMLDRSRVLTSNAARFLEHFVRRNAAPSEVDNIKLIEETIFVDLAHAERALYKQELRHYQMGAGVFVADTERRNRLLQLCSFATTDSAGVANTPEEVVALKLSELHKSVADATARASAWVRAAEVVRRDICASEDLCGEYKHVQKSLAAQVVLGTEGPTAAGAADASAFLSVGVRAKIVEFLSGGGVPVRSSGSGEDGVAAHAPQSGGAKAPHAIAVALEEAETQTDAEAAWAETMVPADGSVDPDGPVDKMQKYLKVRLQSKGTSYIYLPEIRTAVMNALAAALEAVRRAEAARAYFEQVTAAPDEGHAAEDDANSCVICYDDCEAQNMRVLVSCGHRCCEDCMDGHMESQDKSGLSVGQGSCASAKRYTCFTCRQPFTAGDVVPLNIAASAIKTTDDKAMGEMQKRFQLSQFGTKVKILLQRIKEARAKDPTAKFLIFCQWEPLRKKLAHAFTELNLNFLTLGSGVNMARTIDEFQDTTKPDSPHILLVSLERSPAGTNLTAASHVVFVHPFNGDLEHARAAELQAIHRARRIGQTRKEVHVWRLVAKDTVEEEITKEHQEEIERQRQMDEDRKAHARKKEGEAVEAAAAAASVRNPAAASSQPKRPGDAPIFEGGAKRAKRSGSPSPILLDSSEDEFDIMDVDAPADFWDPVALPGGGAALSSFAAASGNGGGPAPPPGGAAASSSRAGGAAASSGAVRDVVEDDDEGIFQ